MRNLVNERSGMTISSIHKRFIRGLVAFAVLALQSVRCATPEQLYENLADQVVLVEAIDDLGRLWKQGSGVVLGNSLCLNADKSEADGTDILSNYHVISFATEV